MWKETYGKIFGFEAGKLPFSPEVISSDVRDGNMRLLKNRQRFLWANGIQHQDFILMDSAHGSKIHLLTDKDLGHDIDADSVITDKKGVAIGLLTADCYPIQLLDPRGVVSFVHAGWKELAGEILSKTVVTMEEDFGTDPASLLIHIGPGICGDDYEVRRDVSSEFKGYFEAKTRKNDQKVNLDLLMIVKKQLEKVRVSPENIREDGRCTFEDGNLYSHRRSTKRDDQNADGRFLTILRIPA